jgi:hypothetical protein
LLVEQEALHRLFWSDGTIQQTMAGTKTIWFGED